MRDPRENAYLSWVTWFFISKTAQPLRLRRDRGQYRLIAQFMEEVPIPDAPEPDIRWRCSGLVLAYTLLLVIVWLKAMRALINSSS